MKKYLIRMNLLALAAAVTFGLSACASRAESAAAAPDTPAAEARAPELDFTDLDGDGNSELSVSFSFPDGTAASLLWFYTDGGFVYSEEFSVQPGETPPAGAEP